MKRLTILGSTGSIGCSTLDVVQRSAERYSIFALAAGRNAKALAGQILSFKPQLAILESSDRIDELTGLLKDAGLPRTDWPQLDFGPRALVAAATAPETDFVMSAVVGVAGLEATYEAVRAHKTIGLANKETLVAGGELVMNEVLRNSVELIPVDSEHNGAHQCLRAGRRDEVERLLLTASGGPFRSTPAAELEKVTPEQALRHPTWQMGSRITIDSATMMNKGFEVIEACWLFGLRPAEVDVVVHPQSKVHAMIEYRDGSLIAQVSTTDMRMPIQYALTYPERCEAPVARMDWTEPRTWEFFPPDHDRFPLLRTAYEAMKAGGSAGCTLNAADEVAVGAFLGGEIPFPSISRVIRDTLEAVPLRRIDSLECLLEVDRLSRERAREAVRRCVSSRSVAVSEPVN